MYVYISAAMAGPFFFGPLHSTNVEGDVPGSNLLPLQQCVPCPLPGYERYDPVELLKECRPKKELGFHTPYIVIALSFTCFLKTLKLCPE